MTITGQTINPVHSVDPFEFVTCYFCGCVFAVPQQFVTNRRKDHKSFFCPSGHSQAFLGETEEEKQIKRLRQQVQNQQEELLQLWDADAQQREAERDAKRTTCDVAGCKARVMDIERHKRRVHGQD